MRDEAEPPPSWTQNSQGWIRLWAQAYVAFMAAPAVGYRLAADPAEPSVRRTIQERAKIWRRGAGQLVGINVNFEPTGDGARGILQYDTGTVSMECRVRRDSSLVIHAHSGEAIDDRPMFAYRPSPADRLWRELEKPDDADAYIASQRSEAGLPSTVVSPAVAMRLYPDALSEKAVAFLDLIHGVYDLGGWRGPVRLDVAVVGKGAFPAVSTNIRRIEDFLALSETITLRASIEFDYSSLETRSGDLVEELMRRVAHNFGMDGLPNQASQLS